MNEAPKICKACAFRLFTGFADQCMRVEANYIDLVTGEAKIRPCRYMRDAIVGACGEDGNLYAPRDDAATAKEVAA